MKKIYKLNFFFTLCVYLWLSYAYGAVPQKTSITSSNTGGTIVSISSTNNVNPLLTTIHKLIKQGDIHYGQKHYPTAVAYYKEALQKYAQNYTGNDLLYALICNNLGVGLLGLKVYQQSYLCLHQALTIRHQYLSIDKPPFNNEEMRKEISKLTGESHYSLGCLYLAIGKHQEAIISFKAAMSTEFSAINTLPEMQLVGDNVGDNVGDHVGNHVGDHVGDKNRHSHSVARACTPRRNFLRHHESNTKGVRAERSKVPTKGIHAERSEVPNKGVHTEKTEVSPEKKPHKKKFMLAKKNQKECLNFPKKASAKTHLSQDPEKINKKQQVNSQTATANKKVVQLFGNTSRRIPSLTKPLLAPIGVQKISKKGIFSQYTPTNYTKKSRFSCTQCGRSCGDQHTLTIHIRSHTGERPFVCSVCQKKFSAKHNLKVHLRTHTGDRPFQCPICHKKFTQKQHMKTHLRTHTGKKPFICPVCRKKFIQKQHMKTHLSIHSDEKPFICPVYRKKFTKKQHMQDHLKYIHK